MLVWTAENVIQTGTDVCGLIQLSAVFRVILHHHVYDSRSSLRGRLSGFGGGNGKIQDLPPLD